ncbi:amidohydrolase, partial [Bradyrhizobium elkanii]
MLADLSPQGRAARRADMARLAQCPNGGSKPSGLGTGIQRNGPAHIAGIGNEPVASSGAERGMVGSAVPVEQL